MDVPRDLAIAGFDDPPLAAMVWPELTTVRRPLSEMAREAVRLLLEQVRAKRNGKTLPAEHKLLGFTLVTRDSTSPAGARRKKT